MNFKSDCRFFRGDKPCVYKMLCEKCAYYQPVKKRILIIKLAAIGDVLRTTPLLERIKKTYPDCWITWVVDKSGREVLDKNVFIDSILEFNTQALMRLLVEKYDIAACLDKDSQAVSLMMLCNAKEKFGFGMDGLGKVCALNKEAEYNFRLGMDDELKFRKNRKTYPELIFEIMGWKYQGEEYILNLTGEEKKAGRDFFKKQNVKDKDIIVGLNTGCGSIFAAKKWTEGGFIKLAKMLLELKGVKVALLGGPEEQKRNRRIKSKVKRAIDTRCDNPLRRFAALVDCCSVVVSADTIAMHLAIALKKRVIAVFGPTCAQEIELFGRGEKIVAARDCAPCYKQACDTNVCMEGITAEMVYSAVKRQIEAVKTV